MENDYIIINNSYIKNRINESINSYINSENSIKAIEDKEILLLLHITNHSKKLESLLKECFDAGIKCASPNIRPEDRMTKEQYINNLISNLNI